MMDQLNFHPSGFGNILDESMTIGGINMNQNVMSGWGINVGD